MGGDLSIMMNFERSFDPSEEISLDKSFRFGDGICRFTSDFIRSNPYQKDKELQGQEKEEGEVYLVWCEDGHEVLKETIDRIRKGENGGILVVGRYDEKDYGDLDFDVVRVGALLEDPELDIEYLKAHDSRGKESDYVILVGVKSGRLGFPSEIEDDVVLDLVRLEDEKYPYAEERRLFYVAATRARKGVYILADKNNPSPFSLEIKKGNYDFIELGEPP
jgi:DNA helicase-4